MAEGKVSLAVVGLLLSCGFAACALLVAVVRLGSSDLPPEERLALAAWPKRDTAQELYATTTGLRHKKLPARIEAARRLATHPGGGPWIALLLVSSQNATTGNEIEQERQADRREFDLGVVAVVLKALPQAVDAAVLWAMTYLLDEERRGRWSEEAGLIIKRKSDHTSAPIRELARGCLRDRVRGDHGWDASAWRVAILNREGVNVRPSTRPSTQPSTQPKAHR